MYSYTPLPPGVPNVGLRSTDPVQQAEHLASRGVHVAAVDAAGEFITQPTRDFLEIRALAKSLPQANWAAPCGPEFGIVVLDIGPFSDPSEHELGALSRTWTIVRSDGRSVHKVFRIPSIAAEPIGRLEGIVTVKSRLIIPGSIHATSGARYHWADGFGPGEAELSSLAPDWMWSLKATSRAISAVTEPASKIVFNPQSTHSKKASGSSFI